MNEENVKCGFCALLGRPNVGKSTLMNHLIGQKIAITSEKPQTTRNSIRTCIDEERGQIIFLDTPGIHRAKNKLSEYMGSVSEGTINEADVIVWLVEPDSYIGPGEEYIIKLLEKTKKPKILVINKADTLKGDRAANEERLKRVREAFSKRLSFEDIISVSAYKGRGLSELKEKIFDCLPYGPRLYDRETVTDQTMREIAGELIREQALRKLNDEVPHGIAVLIDQMKERNDGTYDISAQIICEREAHKGIIIGKGGSMLKRIGTGARIEIEKMTESRVNLKLFVKVRKDWRENESFLREYGYK